ncbi:MAG: GreA/GreB family elongation factor [Kiritimatiellales bacterium]|nr:GreA/GreB family elongation factor [Kiritimatiellales bacterium]
MADLSTVNEEWFLGQLEAVEIDAPGLVDVFTEMAEADRGAEADEWAALLRDTLMARDDISQALHVLRWQALARGTVDDLKGTLEKMLSKHRNERKLIEPAGFGTTTPVKECFERLRHLRSLKKKMLCYNKTWGFGIITRVDHFYQRVEIDFELKGDHELAFNYAAEALDVLTNDHILAIKHKTPEVLQQMVSENPAEVVRITLRSYGPLSVPQLQEMLVPSVLAEADWKKFWDSARKVLKNDASVEIPRKRSESIVLHKKALAYDDEWFAVIRADCDIPGLFVRFKEILEKKIDVASEAAQEALANRLAFIINGAPLAHPEWKAEGIIYARTFGVEPAGLDLADLIRKLIAGDLVTALERLPARQLQTLLKILIETDKEAVTGILEEVIPVVSYPVLNEIMSVLVASGGEEAVRSIMSAAVAKRTAGSPMLLWCQRTPELIEKWNLISKGDLAFRIQEVLEVHNAGLMLRAQNQLRERFQQEEWLQDVMAAMTEQQRRDFLRRANEGLGWDTLDRKSVVAKILRQYPKMQDVILAPKGSEAPKKEISFTSKRSYAARQSQLERIMMVEIPENSKEIELARSYGDLRENAEFKYAKERQGLLMAQSAQIAEELAKVKPTDFANVSTDAVAMGTGVELVFEDGTVETWYVLGAWDQNEALSTVSSETRLAKALIGHTVGETLTVPAGQCLLKAILPLSDEIKAWVNG